MIITRRRLLVSILISGAFLAAQGFSVVPTPTSRARSNGASTVATYADTVSHLKAEPSDNNDKNQKKGVLDFVFNPYETQIPDEIRKDIYAAEANTPAAQDRAKRIGLYAAIAFGGILCAFFNGFLTELRTGDTPDGLPFDMDGAGFGWVTSNFATEFLFTNKLGGLFCLLGGAASGLLAEAEFDTKRINAEKIYEEMVRRRAEKQAGGGGTKKVQKRRAVKKRRSGKESKRMSALSEVVSMDSNSSEVSAISVEQKDQVVTNTDPVQQEDTPTEKSEGKEDGLVGKLKGFYDKADSMAASQALLLNKKLEDEGLIDKITDETGLKVVGKEAAAKLKKEETEKEGMQ